ncbi:MAG: ComF family protein, partial [Nitrososphaera sp.]
DCEEQDDLSIGIAFLNQKPRLAYRDLAFSFKEVSDGILIKRDGKILGTYNVVSKPKCLRCSYPLLKSGQCPRAGDHSPALAKLYSIGLYYKYDHKTYDDLSRTIVYLKRHVHIAERLAATIVYLIKSKYQELLTFDCITPVPQHPSALKVDTASKLRYNQAAELAKWIQEGIPQLIVVEALAKTKNVSMGNTGESERDEKTSGLYECISNIVENKKVLLVDDVSTTGNTLNTCAKALVNSRAKEVRAFVCGINHRD